MLFTPQFGGKLSTDDENKQYPTFSTTPHNKEKRSPMWMGVQDCRVLLRSLFFFLGSGEKRDPETRGSVGRWNKHYFPSIKFIKENLRNFQTPVQVESPPETQNPTVRWFWEWMQKDHTNSAQHPGAGCWGNGSPRVERESSPEAPRLAAQHSVRLWCRVPKPFVGTVSLSSHPLTRLLTEAMCATAVNIYKSIPPRRWFLLFLECFFFLAFSRCLRNSKYVFLFTSDRILSVN